MNYVLRWEILIYSAIKSETASPLLPAAANLSEANLSEAAQHTEKTERPPPLVLLKCGC